ncbi:ABC transporter substrate-binding protein [Haliea sp. E17]|uniref:ABC transporter substrate-binding protein n=1 Tax=Haliea sp. E17 TaxID=3401576 RepID=UPI003AB0E0A0
MKLRLISGLTLLLITALSGCGGSEDKAPAEVAKDNTAEVEAYYAEHPDFFSFKTPADLPADLHWENGMDLPDIGSPEAKKGGTQYMALQDFPRTLRLVGPDANGSFRTYILDYNHVNPAHRHPDKFTFYPGTAESWAVDMENRTVYVKLNPKARWSDGEPLTSDDFLFMFFMFQSSYIVAPWMNNWYSTQYTNITRYDEHTYSITAVEAKPDLDFMVLNLPGMPQHFFRELGEDYVDRYQWRNVPSTGPFVIRDEDIQKGRSIALTRIKDWWARDLKYWRNRYNPDRIQLSVIRETPKVFEAFKRGDIDVFGLGLAEYWYEKLPDSDPDVQQGYIHKSVFYNDRPRATWGLWINSSKPLLDNRDIRVGIQHASNWGLVIEKFFRGDYTRLNTASDGFGEFSHPTLKARDFDIDAALAAFARAGFTQRGPDGILVNDQGQRLSFTLTTGYEGQKDILTILKEEAAKAGLEFRLEVLDSTAAFKLAREKKHDIQFTAFSTFLEMYPRYWGTMHSDTAYDDAFLDDGSVNPQRKVKTQTNNLEEFADPEMDRLIDAYRKSSDKDEMIELAHRMDELHHDYAAWVPGYYDPFYRIGHWRWVRFPEFFNHKHSENYLEYWVHWIDTDLKQQTLDARKTGEAFEPEITVYEQFR